MEILNIYRGRTVVIFVLELYIKNWVYSTRFKCGMTRGRYFENLKTSAVTVERPGLGSMRDCSGPLGQAVWAEHRRSVGVD